MAFYLEGFVACESETNAMSVKRSLGGLPFLHPIQDAATQRDSLWWIHFKPEGLSLGAPCDTDQMRQTNGPNASELIGEIYQLFADRTDFKIFLVGWEVDDTLFDPTGIEHIQLGEVQFPENLYTVEGLVLSDELYDLHQRKAEFTSFCKGYQWIQPRDGHWQSPYRVSGIPK